MEVLLLSLFLRISVSSQKPFFKFFFHFCCCKLSINIRREIATKVLGSKMLQGWTLKEKTCDSCAMPLMENKGKESCPVCPALAKRAKKQLKKQQKLQAEKERLAKEVRAKKDLMERKEEFPHIQAKREVVEVRAFTEDEEATQRAEERKRALQEEKERILALETPLQTAAVEDETLDDKDEGERASRTRIVAEKTELQRLEAIAKEEEERRDAIAKTNGKESEIALQEFKAKQDAAAKELAEEADAIEAFDEATMADDKTEAMKKDYLVGEHRKTIASKLAIDDEVARLEEERLIEAMEARRIAEERRIESENRMIAALEADAAMKALAAEDAIRRAKEALQEVSNTKQQMISLTIEMAEKEALAETEESLKARFEEHSEPVILPSSSEIYEERWETLRLEGRAIMTRRLLKGWAITSKACVFEECHNSPLIEKEGIKECVVCGGCGNGKDGACVAEKSDASAEQSHVPPSVAKSMARAKKENKILDEDWLGNGQEEKFEEMRKVYAMEMGKKMLAGWKIVDSACPKCVMPMMMDEKGNSDICIVNGCNVGIGHNFDASTIATKDMAESLLQGSPTDETDLVSTIMKQAPKQQKKKTPVVSSDPPAYKPTLSSGVIPLPTNVDFADASAIRELIASSEQQEQQQIRDDSLSKDASIDTVANLFLKSPHGYDFKNFGLSMSVDQVQELVEIFLMTNLDKDISETFQLEVAKRIISKMNGNDRQASEPLRLEINTQTAPDRFRFDDDDYTHSSSPSKQRQQRVKVKPFPEHGARVVNVKMPPRSPGFRQLSPVYAQQMRSPRSQSPRSLLDDVSCISRASTVASDALESIYDRIDQCKMKLLDPTNSIDEQIATAALLEKLAQAAVAMKEMEDVLE